MIYYSSSGKKIAYTVSAGEAMYAGLPTAHGFGQWGMLAET